MLLTHRQKCGADPLAYVRRWSFDANEGTRGNRPPGWKLKDVTGRKLMSDDVPLHAIEPHMIADPQALAVAAQILLANIYRIESFGPAMTEIDKGLLRFDRNLLKAMVDRHA